MYSILITMTPAPAGGKPHIEFKANVPDKETCDFMLREVKGPLELVWRQKELKAQLAEAGGQILLPKKP